MQSGPHHRQGGCSIISKRGFTAASYINLVSNLFNTLRWVLLAATNFSVLMAGINFSYFELCVITICDST